MFDSKALARHPIVSKALADHKALTPRPLLLKHLDEWVRVEGYPVKLPGPAFVPFDDRDEVYLGDTLPEHMAVHEIVHAILRDEGFPDYEHVPTPGAKPVPYQAQFEEEVNQFHNKLQHPEIYRRMQEVYGLDMEPYKSYVAGEFHQQAKAHAAQRMFQGAVPNQVQMFNVLDLLHLQPHSEPAISFIRGVSPAMFDAAAEATGRFVASGTATPQAAFAGITAFWKAVVEFGVREGNSPSNRLWQEVRWFLPEPPTDRA